MKKFNYKIVSIFAIIFFALTINVFGQSMTLLSPISVDLLTLPSGLQNKIYNIQESPNFTEIQFIRIGDLKSMQNEGLLNMEVPGKDCDALVQAKHVESFENGDFYWYCVVIKDDTTSEQSCNCYDGSISFIRKNGIITGSINIDEDSYGIDFIKDSIYILMKRKPISPTKRCETEDSDGYLQNSEIVQDRGGSNCPVKVLAVYTQKAEDSVLDINSVINLTIKEVNQGFLNSDISENELKLILVDTKKVSYIEGSFFDEVMTDFIDDTIIQKYRNDVAADIVVCFVYGDYGSDAGFAYGILGKAGSLLLEPEKAYCVIGAPVAQLEFTGAHEISHLFGCRHERSADSNGAFEHAHCFKTGCWPFRKRRNTIMWSEVNGRTIHHFSNPNVSFKGKPTGTDEDNNSNKLKSNACTVAGFRGDFAPQTLYVSLTGPNSGCVCESVNVYANVTGGLVGGYICEWATSTDGFNYTPFQTGGATFSVSLSCQLWQMTFIKLRVTSSDGQIANAFFQIQSSNYDLNGPCWRSNQQFSSENIGIGKIIPNPISDSFTFEGYYLTDSELITFELFDNYGKAIYCFDKILSNADFFHTFESEGLPSGNYFLRVKSKSRTSCYKILKN